VTEAGGWTATKDALSFDGEAWTPVAPMPNFQNETVRPGPWRPHPHLQRPARPKGPANLTWQDQGDIDLHQVFDAAANTWATARPCPLARNSAAGAVIDGRLYLVGGRRVGEGNSAQLDSYDPKTDSWRTSGLCPAPPPALPPQRPAASSMPSAARAAPA
jgi:hypothetical protein